MAAEKKTVEQRIAELKEKQKQLKAQERKLKAQQSQAERKERTHHLIEMGGGLYSALADNAVEGGSYQDGDLEKLVAFLKKQDERGNFFTLAMGRTPKPKPKR